MNPYPFQKGGARWLATHCRGYLADDCGLGKTVQAVLAAIRVGAKRTLVVAPASAIPNWYHAWREMSAPGYMEAQSYSKVRAKPEKWMHGGWDTVVLDEAHYVKNADAGRTKAALDIARRADRAWMLSATPVPNHAGELWPLMAVLFPGIPRHFDITNRWQWDAKFTTWRTDPRSGARITTGSKNGALLKPFLNRIMLRRLWGDPEVGVQLPPLRVDTQLLPHHLPFAKALHDLGLDPKKIEAKMDRAEEDEKTSSLRRLTGLWKAPLIARVLAEELTDRAYEKIVVLGHHRDTLAVFRDALKKFGVAYVDGSVSAKAREAEKQRFVTEPDTRVFLAQQTATGTGTDGLQVSHEIVLAEPDWTPDNNYQYIRRIYRIGTDAPCRARLFAVEGTLDEAIINVAARKTRTKAGLGL